MGQSVTPCPWLTLLAVTPATIGGLVRVPHLAVAFIPLQNGFVCPTVWAVLMCGLRFPLRWWLCGWLRWSLDAEPLRRLLHLRLDAGEVHAA